MKQKLLTLFLLVVLVQLVSTPALAADDPTASTSSSVKAKLDALKQEIASRAAQIKMEVNRKIANKAWAGMVKEKNNDYLMISGVTGDRKVIINEYTKYVAKPKTSASLKDVVVNDFIYALGDVDDANNLTAKQLVKTKAPTIPPPPQIWGQVSSVNGNNIKIASKSGSLTVVAGASTDYQLGPNDASMADAKVDRYLIAVGQVNNGQLAAQFIYYIPGAGYTKPEASASAKPTATASAKATAKPTIKATAKPTTKP